MSTETTSIEHDGSLEGASKALVGLLSASEKQKPSATPPEQRATSKEVDAEQAPTATEPEPDARGTQADSEQATKTDDTPVVATPESAVPRVFKVKVDGQDVEVPEDELVKGYSRTADYTRKTQELAEQRRRFETEEVGQLRAERAKYADHLAKMETAITELQPKEPNWAQLRADLPIEQYVARKEEWEERQKALTTIRTEQARVHAAQAADAEQGFQRYVQEQQAKLEDALPEMKDPEKAPVIRQSLLSFAQDRGFSADELHLVTDHRLVLLLHDAMQHHQAKTKAPVIQNRIDRVIEAASPGNPRTAAPKQAKRDAAVSRLQKSGRVEDAAAAIAAID